MRNGKLYLLAVRALARVGALLALAAVLVPVAPAIAAPAPTVAVEAVQWPAWLLRSGERRPLVIGEILKNGDHVVTGTGGRLLLRLADGSGVKLGEGADLALNALGRRPGGVMTAALDVASGAFRFTTGLFQGGFKHRAVNVRLATLTAGIRGTDLWGKSDAERDWIMLLEGRISVAHPLASEAQTLDQPLTYYAAPKGQAPAAVTAVDAAQAQRWAAETELEAGGGVGSRHGRWSLRLAPVASSLTALERYDELRAAGYPARIRVLKGEAGYDYAVTVGGLASRADAERAAARLAASSGAKDIAIGR